MFLEGLATGAGSAMRVAKRKTLRYADIGACPSQPCAPCRVLSGAARRGAPAGRAEQHVLRKPRMEFLHEHIVSSRPKDVPREPRGGDKAAACEGLAARTSR